MRKAFAALLAAFYCIAAVCCAEAGEFQTHTVAEGGSGEAMEYVVEILVNGFSLTADIVNNDSGAAFLQLLNDNPLTISMQDYGNFEKVGDLPTSLPTNDERITTEPGDIILYLGNYITIYYDINSWSFTRLGKIRNVDRETLLHYLGNGSVDVTFALPEPTPTP